MLILGFANLVADGISMGFGDYLSDSTERDYILSRKKLTDWEVRNNLHSQMLEMVGVYEEHGMERQDAERVCVISTMPCRPALLFSRWHPRCILYIYVVAAN